MTKVGQIKANNILDINYYVFFNGSSCFKQLWIQLFINTSAFSTVNVLNINQIWKYLWLIYIEYIYYTKIPGDDCCKENIV